LKEMSDNDNLFVCTKCGLSIKFDYFGKTPPFTKSLVIMEDAFVMKDPFSDVRNNCIIIGSRCVSCSQMVCVSQDCSIFYTKRFCVDCVHANFDTFPAEIRQELTKRKTSS
jgi:hypothetical protein